jgi:PAS domain S-box-containing protein
MPDNLEKLRELTLALNLKESDTLSLKDAIDSSNIWEIVFDEIPVCMCIASNDTYFKRVNKKFSDVMGYTKEELLSKPYTDYVHPDDLDTTYAEAGRIGAREFKNTQNFTNRYLTKSGEYIKLRWVSSRYGVGLSIAIAFVIEI